MTYFQVLFLLIILEPLINSLYWVKIFNYFLSFSFSSLLSSSDISSVSRNSSSLLSDFYFFFLSSDIFPFHHLIRQTIHHNHMFQEMIYLVNIYLLHFRIWKSIVQALSSCQKKFFYSPNWYGSLKSTWTNLKTFGKHMGSEYKSGKMRYSVWQL